MTPARKALATKTPNRNRFPHPGAGCVAAQANDASAQGAGYQNPKPQKLPTPGGRVLRSEDALAGVQRT